MAWEVKGDLLKTRWANEVDPENVLPEYPRPQMCRNDWMNLNGLWNYAIRPKEDKKCENYDGEILVPFGVESPLSGVMKTLTENDKLWYNRKFSVPKDWETKKIILHFGAVDWQTEVFVNGESVGTHTGGYTPFSFDITDKVNKDGENDITISVFDPTDKGWQNRGKQVQKIYGFWYTPTSGIWQTVWLEPVSKFHFKNVKITPDIDRGHINFETDIVNRTEDAVIVATVYEDGKAVAHAKSTVDKFHALISKPRLWSPENPFLYDITLRLQVSGVDVDVVKMYCGMRKVSVSKDRFGTPRIFLNNKPYFQNGLLDQGFWPDGIYTAPTDEALKFDILKMKELGFNMLRKHIKTEPARWYYYCDKLGMLVWQDMPSGGKALEVLWAGVLPNLHIHVKDKQYKRFHRDEQEWRDQFESEMYEMIDSLYNFPSIVCWVPFNEGWGQFDAYRIGHEVKQYDPTRLVDHASGWHDQGGCDFKSAHIYILPLAMQHRTKGRPYIISEYGGYSHIVRGNTWDESSSFGYRMFKSIDILTDKYAHLMRKQLLPLIKKGLSATVYTQVTDVENEVNGIYTYDREVLKMREKDVKEINAEIADEYKKLGILR